MLGQDLDLSNQTFENFDSLIRFLAAKEAGGGGDSARPKPKPKLNKNMSGLSLLGETEAQFRKRQNLCVPVCGHACAVGVR